MKGGSEDGIECPNIHKEHCPAVPSRDMEQLGWGVLKGHRLVGGPDPGSVLIMPGSSRSAHLQAS